MGDLPSGDPDTTQPSLGAHTTDNQRACGRPRPEAVLLAPAPSQSELWEQGGNGQLHTRLCTSPWHNVSVSCCR